MTVSDCIYQIRMGGCKSSSLNATTLQEKQLIDSVHDFIYEIKDLNKVINILTDLTEQCKFSTHE